MTAKQQSIALYTLIRRELIRTFRIFSQVFLPPVITTLLYFMIFGSIIGQRIGPIQGVDYSQFIAPGLIMMTVITNAYANVSSSLFSMRFQNILDELLISPMHPSLIIIGFVVGGVLRGIIVAFLVYIVALFFVDMGGIHVISTLLVITLVATLFALAGFTNGLLANKFDDIAIVPTFILAPLTYLGGVFYSINMLPSFWQNVSYLNPIFYMVNALRHVMIGHEEVHINLAILIMATLLIILVATNIVLMKKGVGLRS